MKKITTLIGAILVLGTSVFGQLKHVENLLSASASDANLLAEQYLTPYGEMLGVNLNSGWYNTAKIHKVGGFDFTIMGTFSKAPDSKMSFNALPEGISSNVSATQPTSPTMAAGKSVSNTYTITEPVSGAETSFDMNGAGKENFISPMVQAAVGLPFHTEIMGRFMPKVEYGDLGKAYLYGFGLKHSLKDYIPFVKRTPFLHLSVLAAYTHFDGSLGVNNDFGKGDFTTEANAFTGRLLIGVNVPVVSFYTGLGYGQAKSNFGLNGTYNVGPGEGISVTDPLAFGYNYSGFDINAGMRLRFGVFAIHADYTVGEYRTITAGIGLSFR